MAEKRRIPNSGGDSGKFGDLHPYTNPANKVKPVSNPVLQPSFEQQVSELFEELEDLLLRKHADYGPTNISAAPGGALNGLRVRMHDKLARLNNLIDNNADPLNESLRDTLLDLANYAAIGVLVLDGKWPK